MRIPASKITISSTTAASIIFIHSARRFAERARVLDDRDAFDALEPGAREQVQNELLDVALAAVISSYSHAEAIINELYQDHAHFAKPHLFPDLDKELGMRLSDAWSDGIEKLNPIEKVKFALAIAHRPPLNWGQGTAQRLRKLHGLRNALMHHKLISVEHGKPAAESGDRIQQTLNQEFPLAAIWQDRNVPFRWNGCLGAGCAMWSYETAEQFDRVLFAQLGTRYPK